MKTSQPPIIVEHDLQSTLGVVWEAITQIDQMTSWFFDNIPAFEAKAGFKTRFVVQSQDRTFTHLWKIKEVVPYQSITYSWKYLEYPGDSLLTFQLIKKNNFVSVKIVMEILEDFPSNIPEFTRDSCIRGWNYFIGKSLKEYLEAKAS